MPAGPKNALALWGLTALRPVLLPSGLKAIVKLPDLGELIRRDVFPQDLRVLASKWNDHGVKIEDLTDEDAARFMAIRHEVAARSVKYLAAPDSEAWDAFRKTGADPEAEGWEPVTLTGTFFREGDVDVADIEALMLISARTVTPNDVTVLARRDLGLDPVDEPAEGGRMSDYAEFREGPGGDSGRDDGEGVGTKPGGVPRRERPRSRLRSR